MPKVTPADVVSGIGIIADLAVLVADQLGKTTDEVLAEAAADCARRAVDPTDETDAIAAEIDASLPDGSSER